jgi:PKD repeat protein
MKSWISGLCILITGMVFGQTAEEIVLKETNIDELIKFENRVRLEFEAKKALAIKLAKENGWEIKVVSEEGTFELIGVDENGNPEHIETTNLNAAKTISTNRVHNGGGAGYNLEGQNMTLGIWDGAGVRASHQEFNGRVSQRDGASYAGSDHATHVAGTMIARGVNPSAKGMAPQARLWAYDWNNDLYEMSQAARSSTNPLLISGHSYGTRSGFSYDGANWYWYGDESISTYEDYKFGFYDTRARDWDQLARLAPYYLICKSAGNDRNDYYSGSHYVYVNGRRVRKSTSRKKDGDYNSISTYGNAKNILTIGAINDIPTGYRSKSDVVMTNFSCWGPTDDGRIKPDLVANGVSVRSTSNTTNSAYSTASGTSMSTPSVAGSLLLLQPHYRSKNFKFMRSATLKALAIHTADEAGSFTGPDYKYGWGLVNTKKAADAISSSSIEIEEKLLTNGGKYSKRLNASGSNSIRITICWTDYEGTPSSPRLNPTNIMLRNDLDIRLVHDNGSIRYMPYVLNPNLPNAAPTKGDNFRDNVEQIFIPTPLNGGYKLEVSHKGGLVGGVQPFSLIIEGFTDKPTASFTKNKNHICKGDTIYFTNASSGVYTSSQWKFTGGHISTSNQTNPFVIYNSAGTFSAQLKVSNGSIADSITSIITVRELPKPNIINDTTFCIPIIGNRQIYTDKPGGVWNGYPWMKRLDSCIFKPNLVGEGKYPIKYSFTDVFGCSGSDSSVVIVSRAPKVELSLPVSNICVNSAPIALSGGIPAGGKYWVSGNRDSLFTPSNHPVGYVDVIYSFFDSLGCKGSALDYFIIEECTGIEAPQDSKGINVYPNPFQSQVIISSEKANLDYIRIYDAVGAMVFEETALKDRTKHVLNLSFLNSGNYFLELKTGEQSPKRVRISRL